MVPGLKYLLLLKGPGSKRIIVDPGSKIFVISGF